MPRVTVAAFSLSSDKLRPHTNSPFHLIVTLRIEQRTSQITTLQLPDLAALEILGDERGLSSGPRGTIYREVVTVEARDPGTIALDPATFDAIDARDGRAKQWSTNPLTLHVAGPPGRAFTRILGAAARTAGIAAAVAVTVALFALLVLGAVRRRPEPVVAPIPPPAEEPSAQERMNEALALLRANPTRAGAMAARNILYRMVGAAHGETLHDVMLRAPEMHPALQDVLPHLERAAFTYDTDLAAALAAAIAALERAT